MLVAQADVVQGATSRTVLLFLCPGSLHGQHLPFALHLSCDGPGNDDALSSHISLLHFYQVFFPLFRDLSLSLKEGLKPR